MYTLTGKHCPNVKMKPCTTRHEPKGHAMVQLWSGVWVGAELVSPTTTILGGTYETGSLATTPRK